MAHFAELDANDIVTRVVVVNNSEIIENGVESEAKGIAFLQSLYGHCRWVQTSYNGNIRGRYAEVGMKYDSVADTFDN